MLIYSHYPFFQEQIYQTKPRFCEFANLNGVLKNNYIRKKVECMNVYLKVKLDFIIYACMIYIYTLFTL